MRDFREPTRMGWEALVVLVVNGLWGYLKAMWLLFIAFFVGKSGKTNIIFGILIVLIALLTLWNTLVKYFTTRLWIRDGKLVCTTGLLSKKEESFPLNRIHAQRTRRNPIYQIVDMVGVVFDTVADKGAELEFILSEEDWTRLSQLVAEEEVHEVAEESRGIDQPLWSYRMTPLDLLRGALVQNHLKGMALVGGVLAFVYGQIPNAEQWIEKIAVYLEDNYLALIGQTSVILVVTLLVSGYLISLIIWCIFTLVKYWGLTLDFHSSYIVYKAGLFNKVTVKLFRDKVIALSTKTNPLEQKLGLDSFRLEQATNVEGKKGENIITLPSAACLQGLKEWLYGTKEQELLTQVHSQKPLFWYSFVTWWLLFTPLFGVIIYFDVLIGVLISCAITIAILWKSQLQLKKSNIQLLEDYIQLHSGSIANRKVYLRYQDIEHIETRHLNVLGYRSKNRHLKLYTKGYPKSIRSLIATSLSTVVDYILLRSSNTSLNRSESM